MYLFFGILEQEVLLYIYILKRQNEKRPQFISVLLLFCFIIISVLLLFCFIIIAIVVIVIVVLPFTYHNYTYYNVCHNK